MKLILLQLVILKREFWREIKRIIGRIKKKLRLKPMSENEINKMIAIRLVKDVYGPPPAYTISEIEYIMETECEYPPEERMENLIKQCNAVLEKAHSDISKLKCKWLRRLMLKRGKFELPLESSDNSYDKI